TPEADAACRGACCAQSGIFCAGRCGAVAMAAKRLGAARCAGQSDDRLCPSAMCGAVESRQLRAALYAGVFSVADCLGQLSISLWQVCASLGELVLGALVLVDCGLLIGLNLIGLLIDLLVVLDVGVDGGSVIS